MNASGGVSKLQDLKALKADIVGIAWNDSAVFYRPKYQARSEVYVATNWLSRFPSGNLGILAGRLKEAALKRGWLGVKDELMNPTSNTNNKENNSNNNSNIKDNNSNNNSNNEDNNSSKCRPP